MVAPLTEHLNQYNARLIDIKNLHYRKKNIARGNIIKEQIAVEKQKIYEARKIVSQQIKDVHKKMAELDNIKSSVARHRAYYEFEKEEGVENFRLNTKNGRAYRQYHLSNEEYQRRIQQISKNIKPDTINIETYVRHGNKRYFINLDPIFQTFKGSFSTEIRKKWPEISRLVKEQYGVMIDQPCRREIRRLRGDYLVFQHKKYF